VSRFLWFTVYYYCYYYYYYYMRASCAEQSGCCFCFPAQKLKETTYQKLM